MPRCVHCDRVRPSAEISRNGRPHCKDKTDCARARAKTHEGVWKEPSKR